MKRILALLLICAVLSGCGAAEAPESRDGITFTDSMDRTVTVSAPQRVGICSGSLAECWLLSGGEITAVTRDAVTERNLEFPENYIDLGSLKEPSAEAILTADLDFVILMSSLPNHVALAETLEKTKTTYAYFDVENFSDYYLASSDNTFLMIWAEDFGTRKAMKKPEYFVYFDFSIAHDCAERFAQIAKGVFEEVLTIGFGSNSCRSR